MPSKLKKAIGAVKDHTSIGLAMVGGTHNSTSNLEVAILKATSHDEVPMDERYVNDILQLIASNKVYAATCAHAISKRVGKTKNWIVALKSLMLVLRIFRDGDPYFPREVLHTMKKGGKILNLSSFRDHSKNTNPWDYTAYVRTFALYLDERLDCFLSGKLQRRAGLRKRENGESSHHRRTNELVIRDMKPAMLLDRISYWQRLLDRAMATRPTGAAKNNNLVQISLYAVVQETFDLYRDMSDGLALLLDSFFHLPYQTCVHAFQTCVKASKQFEELTAYYNLCKNMGIGRPSEYPSVHTVSDELMDTLREFLKDQDSFPANMRSSSTHVLNPSPVHYTDPSIQSEMPESVHGYPESTDMSSEVSYGLSSRCTSIEDLISVANGGASPSVSTIHEHEQEDYFAEQHSPEYATSNDEDNSSGSGQSSPPQEVADPAMNFLPFDDWPELDQNPLDLQQPHSEPTLPEISADIWELLGLTASQVHSSIPPATNPVIGLDGTSLANDPFKSVPAVPRASNNPFLDDPDTLIGGFGGSAAPATTSQPFVPASSTDLFVVAPTFQAASAPPTFHASSNTAWADDENDPFSSSFNTKVGEQGAFGGCTSSHTNLQHEQEMWLQQQRKIIAKHLA